MNRSIQTHDGKIVSSIQVGDSLLTQLPPYLSAHIIITNPLDESVVTEIYNYLYQRREVLISEGKEWGTVKILDSIMNELNYGQFPFETKYRRQQYNQRNFGNLVARNISDKIGEKILEIEATITPQEIITTLEGVQTIRDLLNLGALKTARQLMRKSISIFPRYTDLFEYGCGEVDYFLTLMNYE